MENPSAIVLRNYSAHDLIMLADIPCLLILLLAVVKGYRAGLIIALCSFLGFFIGLIIAFHLSGTLAIWIKQHYAYNGRWLPALSFIILFLSVLLFVKLLANTLEKAADFVMLGWINKIGGVFFYLVISSFMIAGFLRLFDLFGNSASFLKDSVLCRTIYSYSIETFSMVAEFWPSFRKTLDYFEGF